MFCYRLLNLYGFMLCIGSLLFAIFYLEKILYLDPCPLCVLDRVVLVALGAVFFIAFLHNPRSLFAKVYGTICVILCLVGILLSGRHIWLQNLPKDQVPECGPDIYYMIDTLPIFEVLKSILSGSGSCADISWTFLGLTIPQQTLLLFIILMILTFIQLLRPQKSN